jgi:YHS domain-containing protein
MFAFIERLILLTVAISVVRSLLRFLHGFWLQSQSRGRAARPVPGQTAATMLQCDPVCGTYVAVDSSLKKISGGKVYHFCSPECRERFTG